MIESLQIIKDDYMSNKENFNMRKYIRLLRDDKLKDFFKDKYPKAKTISEKIYLYLNDLNEPKENMVFNFDKFEYVPKNQPIKKSKDIPIANPVSVIESNLTTEIENIEETLLTFDEKTFFDKFNEDDKLYIMKINHSSGNFLAFLYNQHKDIIYVCMLPKTTDFIKLKEFLEKDYKIQIELWSFPLSLFNKVSDANIVNSNTISSMAYVLSKRHILFK